MSLKYNSLLFCSVFTAGAVLLTVGIVAPAMGQSATNDSRGVIEEVIVTAQKRAENLQEVPMAVSVFTGDELRRQGILDLKSLSERTPGLYIGKQKPGQAQFYLRGVGSGDDGPSSDASVPLFIDEMYIPRTASQIVDLFDLERIEVLRGPQGTLFGRNAAGGAIHLITKKPSETPEAEFEASFGNLDLVNLRAYVSGPVAGDLYGKVAVSSRKRDGYMESVAGNYPNISPLGNPAIKNEMKFMNIDSDVIRGGLRYIPQDGNLEINVSGSYSTRDEAGVMKHYLPGPGDGGYFYSSDSELIPDYSNNIHKTVHDNPGSTKVRSSMGSLRVDYGMSWGAKLTSLTTYQKTEFSNDDWLATENMVRMRLTAGGGAPPYTFFGDNPTHEDNEAFSQELRLTSSTDGPLQWVAGLYYLNEKADRNETAGLGFVMLDGSGGFGNADFLEIIPVTRGGEDQHARGESLAAFGQVTYAITERLQLTGGIRYTKDEKDINVVGTAGGLVIAENYAGSDSKKWSEATPKVAVDFSVNEDLMVYALASKGYKSGGWQGLAPTGSSALTPFEPEFAWLYEVGAKSEWLDNRLRVNVAAFVQDYEDMQISQSLIPEDAPPEIVAVLFTNNAANSEISGVEVEIEAAPTPNWFFSGMYSYLDTKFSDFQVPVGFKLGVGAPPVEDRVGNKLKRAPKSMWSALARYTHELNNGADLTGQVAYRHIDENYGDVDNLYFGTIPAYDLLDARVTYNLAGGLWTITLWGNNLADEEYFTNVFPNIGSGWATPGPPRTYGFTLNWTMPN